MMNNLEKLIKQIEDQKLVDVEARKKVKEVWDTTYNLSTDQEKKKLTFQSGTISDTGNIEIISEGAIVDPIGIRFVISKGAVANMYYRAMASNSTLLEVNVDHESDAIATGNVGYLDLKAAKLEDRGDGRVALVGSVSLDKARPIITDIARQQELGVKFGVSIEMADTNFESEVVDLGNETIYTIKQFDIKNLAIVRNGANVDSNFNLFNLSVNDTKLTMANEKNTKLQVEIPVVETPVVPEETQTPVVEQPTPDIATISPEVVDETIAAVTAVQAENEEVKAINEVVTEENVQLKSKVEEFQNKLAVLQGIVKIKEIPTIETATKQLAATTVTPYTGTTYINPMDDPTLYRSTIDPIVQELRANDDDVFYPLQPKDANAGNFTPVVRASEFNGWDLGTFDPLTQCCWKLVLTGEAFVTEYFMGSACMSIDTDMWSNLYTSHGQGLVIRGQEGLTPFQKKQVQTVRVLAERANYGILQGDPLAPASIVPAWDGLASIATLAPVPISAANGILGAFDLWITRMNAWFPNQVQPDGTGLVAYMHTVTLQQIKEEQRIKMVQGVLTYTMADKQAVEMSNLNGYRGIRFVASPRYIIDNSTNPTAGQTNIIVTTEGNIAAKLFYLSMGKNGVEFADAVTATPIQIGANILSAIPNCQISSTWVYFAAGLAYAKNRLQIGLITDVQTLTGSQMSGFRDRLGIAGITGKITLN